MASHDAKGRFVREGPDWAAEFLGALRDTGNVRLACQAAGISRPTAYDRRDRDPVFAGAWHWAREDAGELLEGEAWRRAVHGWDEPVYQGGKYVGNIRKYDSNLLVVLLKALKPEVYRERVDMTIDVRQAAERLASDLDGVSPEELIAATERFLRGQRP